MTVGINGSGVSRWKTCGELRKPGVLAWRVKGMPEERLSVPQTPLNCAVRCGPGAASSMTQVGVALSPFTLFNCDMGPILVGNPQEREAAAQRLRDGEGRRCMPMGYAPGVGAAFPRLRPSTKPIPSPMRSAGTG